MLKEVFEYLDILRESGTINMWGAGSFVERNFRLPKNEANRMTGLWMDTFDGVTCIDERVRQAEKDQ